MFYNKLNQCADRGDFSRTYGGASRQTQYHLRKSLSLRQPQVGLRVIGAITFHTVTTRIKIAPGHHVLRPKYIIELVSTNSSHSFVDLDRYVLVITFFIFLISR